MSEVFMNNKVRIRVYLYSLHDYDLVKYYMSLKDKELDNPATSFASVIKNSLRAYVTGSEYAAPAINEFTFHYMPTRIAVRVEIPETEKEILDMINHIETRQINSFVKNLVRQYIPIDNLRCYYPEYTLSANVQTVTSRAENKKKRRAAEREKLCDKGIKELKSPNTKPVNTKPAGYKPKIEEPEYDPGESNFDVFGALGNINI